MESFVAQQSALSSCRRTVCDVLATKIDELEFRYAHESAFYRAENSAYRFPAAEKSKLSLFRWNDSQSFTQTAREQN